MAKKLGFVARLVLGGTITTATLLYFNWDRLVATDSPSSKQASPGVLETAEFTIPIPSGYHVLSKEELLARVAKAKRNSPTEAIVASLENNDHSAIGVSRMPSKPDDPPIPPTTEQCTRLATLTAERGNHPLIAGGTLAEHSRDGLGTSCQFTLGMDKNHWTQVVTHRWFITYLHPPGQDGDCQQVATGFKRRMR